MDGIDQVIYYCFSKKDNCIDKIRIDGPEKVFNTLGQYVDVKDQAEVLIKSIKDRILYWVYHNWLEFTYE